MATHTLTKSSPSQSFTLANDGDVQVLISSDSKFTSLSKFFLEYETDVNGVFIPVPDTEGSSPYSRLYTFKAGKIKVVIEGANDETSIIVDIK